MGLKEKLMNIQTELKAPKGQFNKFGNYKYRSCEDILEAVKPLLAKYKVVLTITDDVVTIADRVYLRACASLFDVEGDERVENVAWAREELEKKGQDASQITGTASSYARKYCLNGLFLIDDTKDADTDEYKKQQEGDEKPAEQKKEKKASPKQMELCQSLAKDRDTKCELLRLIILSMGSEPDEEWISSADDSRIKKFIDEYIPNLSLDKATKFIKDHKESK